MKQPKKTKYTVLVKVMVETELLISAESFEEALADAKTYDVKDVVEFHTPYNDGSIEVVGVYK